MSVVCDRACIDWTIGADCIHATKAGCVGDAVGCNGVLDVVGVIGASVVIVGCNSAAIEEVVGDCRGLLSEGSQLRIGMSAPLSLGAPRLGRLVCNRTLLERLQILAGQQAW